MRLHRISSESRYYTPAIDGDQSGDGITKAKGAPACAGAPWRPFESSAGG